MAMKVEQASSVEPQRVQISVSSSSGASTSSSKVSMFGVKSGFVIPKNKLSGSLVPIFRGAKKVESQDASKEELNKPVQRKTKWGTDLTQDTSVRRGRALAYQTRVEQITQQLKSGVLETGEELGSQSPSEAPRKESSSHQADDQSQRLEALELEKRDAIGEILKLNPSFNAPPDYKPLLKEAKVPIPLKLYPGFNFIGLLLGSGSNTQKRLEEETGAKIRVQGTKSGEAEKGEVTLLDGNEDQSAYAELHVHVSADTFEKVDAAVALIELLVTPVSGNSVVVSTGPTPMTGDSMSALDQSQGATSSYAMPAAVINPGVVQPMMRSTQPGIPQVQFQPYPAPWFPQGSPHSPMRPPSNFGPPSNFSAPMPNNAIQYPQSSSLNLSRMPPHLVGRPPFATGFGMVPRNPSLGAPRPQPPQQGLQRQYFPEAQPPNLVPHLRGHPMPGSQPPLAYPNLPAQHNPAVSYQAIGNQQRNIGPPPPIASHPFPMPQPVSSAPSGPPNNRPFASAGWPAGPVATSAPNMTQVASPMVPPQRPPVGPQTISGMSRPSPGSMVSSASFSPGNFPPQQPNSLVIRPATGPSFSSVPTQGGSAPASVPVPLPTAVPSPGSSVLRAPSLMAPPVSAPMSIFPRAGAPPATASSPALNQSPRITPRPVGPQGSAVGSAPVPPSVPLPSPSPSPQLQPGTSSSISVSIPSFTPLKAPMTSSQSISPVSAPKPPRPSSGDFTFQPLGSQPPASQTASRPSEQHINASSMQTKPVQPPPAPQGPSYRPAMHNAGPQQVMQGFPSSRPSNQFIQPQVPVPPPSPGLGAPNQSSMRPPPPRLASFQNRNPVPPTSSVPQMGPPRGFMQAPQMPTLHRPLPPRMVNPQQLQQNQSTPALGPGNVFVPNQHYSNNLSFTPMRPASSTGSNQVYDPFSPTSISTAPPPLRVDNSAKAGKQENDPEYDDLMASVGMR